MKAPHSLLISCSLLVFLTATVLAQTAPSDLKLNGLGTNEAGPRNGHSMAYDPESKEILLFGGANHEKVFGDLFALRSNSWVRIDATGPGPRTFASFAYAGPGAGVILFGGNKVLFGDEDNPPQMLGDTWIFLEGSWRQIDTQTAPAPRAEAATVYDPVHKRVVLFGGYRLGEDGIERLGDTWEFRNGTWTRLSVTGPPFGNGVAIAFDQLRGTIVLFGGPTTREDRGPGTGRTWILRDERWVQLDTSAPPNMFNAAMATGFGPNGVVRFGGWTGEGRTDQTWVLRDVGWMRIGGRSPAARNHSAMVYDAGNERLVLYGGHDGEYIFGDLWAFDASGWKLISDSFRPKRLDNGH